MTREHWTWAAVAVIVIVMSYDRHEEVSTMCKRAITNAAFVGLGAAAVTFASQSVPVSMSPVL